MTERLFSFLAWVTTYIRPIFCNPLSLCLWCFHMQPYFDTSLLCSCGMIMISKHTNVLTANVHVHITGKNNGAASSLHLLYRGISQFIASICLWSSALVSLFLISSLNKAFWFYAVINVVYLSLIHFDGLRSILTHVTDFSLTKCDEM